MTKGRQSIKVLIVEDSPVVQEFLVHVLDSDPDIRVVGTANNGEEALHAVQEKNPDVVTMDIHMPKVDGFNATRRIMETHPTPIVIVSGSSTAEEIATTFRALDAGALAVIRRPMGIGHPEFEHTAAELIQSVKLMSEVRVVRRWRQPTPLNEKETKVRFEPGGLKSDLRLAGNVDIVAIGASTGGPILLETIFSSVPKNFPLPVLLVQHMASGFVGGFVQWLNESSNLTVHVAQEGEQLQPGHVYVAPDQFHMGVERPGRVRLDKSEPENGHRPSVSFLFRSVSVAYGSRTLAFLLTGMGRDGAEELRLLKNAGAITIAQDKESSVVHGMPGEAIAIGAATYVFTPDQMIQALNSLSPTEKRDS